MDGITMPVLKVKDKEVFFDDEDYKKALQYNWCFRGNYSLCTNLQGKTYSVSKLIFNIKPGQVLVHKDNDPFNYRRSNIILCSRKEAGYITGSLHKKASKYKGVSKNKDYWQIIIRTENKNSHEVFFKEIDAAIAADYYSFLKYKEKAVRNFPDLDFNEIEHLYCLVKKNKVETFKQIKSAKNQGRQLSYKIKAKTSQYIGVSWDERLKKWCANINFKRKKYFLGYHLDERAAAIAYDKKAIELYGSDAKVNILK